MPKRRLSPEGLAAIRAGVRKRWERQRLAQPSAVPDSRKRNAKRAPAGRDQAIEHLALLMLVTAADLIRLVSPKSRGR